jgi:hypothetical protein
MDTMTSVADLVRVLHDIDALRGKTCGTCRYVWAHSAYHDSDAAHCRKGYQPHGTDDGCEDWKPAS